MDNHQNVSQTSTKEATVKDEGRAGVKRKARAQETEEQIALRKQRNAERLAARRAKETEEESALRRMKSIQYQAERRAKETEEQTALRRLKQVKHQAAGRARARAMQTIRRKLLKQAKSQPHSLHSSDSRPRSSDPSYSDETQNGQNIEDDAMEVKDDDILVSIHQAPMNLNPPAAPLTNQEEVPLFPAYSPGLDEELPDQSESDSGSGWSTESEDREETDGKSDMEENEDGAVNANGLFGGIPEEIVRSLVSNPASLPSFMIAMMSLFLPFGPFLPLSGQFLPLMDGTEPNTGMSQEEMDAIPEITINGGPADFEGQRTCSVCMEDFVVGERARQPSCSHLFHQTCLWPWLDLNRTCPSCRRLL